MSWEFSWVFQWPTTKRVKKKKKQFKKESIHINTLKHLQSKNRKTALQSKQSAFVEWFNLNPSTKLMDDDRVVVVTKDETTKSNA